MNIALFAAVWSSRELRSAFWRLISACLRPTSAIWRTRRATLGLGPPWRESEGVLPMEAGGSFCHSTEISFHSPVCWLQHCISAAFEQRKKPNENDVLAAAQSGMTHARPLAFPCCACSHLLTQACICTHCSSRPATFSWGRLCKTWRKPGQPHAALKRWALGLVLRSNAPFLITTAFRKFHPVWSQLWPHCVPVTPQSHGNMLKATNVSKPFLDCGQSPKSILQDQVPDNQCLQSHGNHLLPLDQAKCNRDPYQWVCAHLQVLQFQLQAQMNAFINFLGHICKMGVGCSDIWECSASPQQQDVAGRNIHMRITMRHLLLQVYLMVRGRTLSVWLSLWRTSQFESSTSWAVNPSPGACTP